MKRIRIVSSAAVGLFMFLTAAIIMAVATSSARAETATECRTLNLALFAENPRSAVQEYFAASGIDTTQVGFISFSIDEVNNEIQINVCQQFHGVAVEPSMARLTVEKTSGKLIRWSSNWREIPPTTSVNPVVDVDSATTIVSKYVSENCVQPRVVYPCGYVCDSTYVEPYRLELRMDSSDSEAALVWRVDYKCLEPYFGDYHSIAAGYFDVDGNTGAILGYYTNIVMSVSSDLREQFTPAIQAFPNPFNPATTIRYRIDASGSASVVVHNTAGQVVRRLVENHHAAGTHELIWDGKDENGRAVASGTYHIHLVTPDHVEARAVSLVR